MHNNFSNYEILVPAHLRAQRSSFARWLGRTVLQISGWKIEGEIPDRDRLIICGAPHTSNWDFVFGMAALLAMNARVHWMGKDSIFKPGVRWFMKWLGGIPIDRANPQGIVENIAQMVREEHGVVILVTPEGTRKKVERWKTGFLRIAQATDSTVLLAAIDFPSRRIVLDRTFQPSGDHERDIQEIKQYYSQFKGKHPELF